MADKHTQPDTPENDAVLQLKKRARRRLVGAVALALTAVIVLPMIMDHEPRPPQQDIQVRIPSQDGEGFAGRALNKPTPSPLPPVKVAKPEKAAEPASKPAAAAAEEKPTETAPAPEVAKPAKADPKPDLKPDPKTEAKAELFVLQLGAYQDPVNIKALQAKIKELGYPSYTEKVMTPQGERTRVRAGPFATQAAAEKAQVALKRVGAGGPPGGVIAPK